MNHLLRWTMGIVIFFGALLLFSIFNGNIPITDPVESNYALTAKEMVLSGNWISPQIYGQYWFDKPICIYWLIAGCYQLFGFTEFASRLPSAVFGAGGVVLAAWFSFRLYHSWRISLFSVLVLATSLEYWILSRMIITDMVLFFFTALTMAAAYLYFLNEGEKWIYISYAAAGLAVLTKGPVGLVLPGGILLVYLLVSKQWHLFGRMRWVRGLGVFLVIAAPWYLMMYALHGKAFIDMFLGLHNYLRATVSEHPRDNVFYYYLLLFPVSMLPWTGVWIQSLLPGSRRIRPIHYKFLTVWIAGFLFFYTCMATKYLTYVFPALFPAAILAGWYLEEFSRKKSGVWWWWLTIPSLIFFGGLAAGTYWLPSGDWFFFYLILVAATILLLGLHFWGRHKYLPWAAAVGSICISLTLLTTAIPDIANMRSGKMVASYLQVQDRVGIYGDYSTSAVFYSGVLIRDLRQGNSKLQDVWAHKYDLPSQNLEEFVKENKNNNRVFILVRPASENSIAMQEEMKQYVSISKMPRFIIYKQADISSLPDHNYK